MRNNFIFPIIIAGILLCIGFGLFLGTSIYGYLLFSILGVVFYIVAKSIGKEVYFFLMIPLLCISTYLVGNLFLLDYYNKNGLNPFKLHPFTVAWLVIFLLEFIEMLSKKNYQFFSRVSFLGILTLIIFFVITYCKRGIYGMPILIENYLGPILFFLFFYNQRSLSKGKISTIIRLLIVIAVCIGVYGVIEYWYKYNLLDFVYDEQTWFDTTFHGGYRIKTIIGHPLNNAVFFLFSMVLIQVELKNRLVKYILLLFFAFVILLTGSRSIFMLSFVALSYGSWTFSSKPQFKKKFIIPFSAILVLIFIAFNTSFGSTFLTRLEVAKDSSQSRVLVLQYLIHNLSSFNINGLGTSGDNLTLVNYTNYYQTIIPENPWVMLFFDVSYFCLIYVFFLYNVLKRISHKFLLLIFILGLSVFNSFGVKNNLNYELFYLMSYCYTTATGSENAKIYKSKRIELNDKSISF